MPTMKPWTLFRNHFVDFYNFLSNDPTPKIFIKNPSNSCQTVYTMFVGGGALAKHNLTRVGNWVQIPDTNNF